jgi:hypothetical protein
MLVRPQHEDQHRLGVLTVYSPEILTQLRKDRGLVAFAHTHDDGHQELFDLAAVQGRSISLRNAGSLLRRQPRR